MSDFGSAPNFGNVNWEEAEFKDSGAGPLDPGVYKFSITAAGHDKRSDGEPIVTLELTVIEGDAKGRKMWQNFEFANPDAKRAQKAYQKWINLCHNLGAKCQPNEAHTLQGKVTRLEVDIFENDKGDKFQYIKKYTDYDERKGNAGQPSGASQSANNNVGDQIPF